MSLKKIAVIGGTGLSFLNPDGEQTQLKIVEGLAVKNALGEPSAPLQLGSWQDKELVFLARHGNPPVLPPHCINYRANLLALQAQQVDAIIAVNAVGGITPQAATGALVIPDQIVDYTWGREHTFFDGRYQALKFIDFSQPYDTFLRETIIATAAKIGQPIVPQAVYGATQGPRLESIAEIQRLQRDGCDIVGMTGMPEAALAKELEIPYVSIALVVNPAAGKSPDLITMDEINAVAEVGMQQVQALIAATFKAL